jgi:hypothetical protein
MVNIPKIRDGDVLLWMPAMRPDRWINPIQAQQVIIPYRWMIINCDYRCKEETCGYTYHDEGVGQDAIAQIWLCQRVVVRNEDCGRGGGAPIASTILHELVHEACYVHKEGEEDMPKSCQISCFGGTNGGPERCRQGR